ncbi:CopD family protein [Burkholderia ubonensis]|uniref:CopD family protein n=1 Tax=Burkholderia ubonensis TaxID=101571 RepID=UPI0022B76246|nr:CopD family protein [Burkholderia ubonensis]
METGAALVAVSVVVVGGICNADRGLGGSLMPLALSGWGRILAAKLVLVSVAVVLDGINRLICLPRIRFGASAGSFLAILRMEAVTVLCVLSAAASLAHTIPGAHLGVGSCVDVREQIVTARS